jgi:hypothetical protein
MKHTDKCSSKKTFWKKEKFFEKTGETHSVTGGLRTGDDKKIESIKINLRDLAWSQVFPRDPGLLQPWTPGTIYYESRAKDKTYILVSFFCVCLFATFKKDRAETHFFLTDKTQI